MPDVSVSREAAALSVVMTLSPPTHNPAPTKSSPGDADKRPGAFTVLQVLPALETGGVERGTVDVAAAIVKAGGRAIVASQGGAMVREIERAGAEHVILPLAGKNPFTLRANAKRLASLIEREHVDLVHARSRAPAWSARAAARRTGTPFITTFHGTYNFKTPLKRAYNAIMTKGVAIIAISDFIAEHIKQHYRVPAEKITTIPRGVDIDMFDPDKVPAARVVKLAEDWRLLDGLPVVMLPGRLTRWKGQELFIRAAARLKDRAFIALMVGSDQGRSAYRAELEALTEQLGLQSHVRFVDHCRDMPAALLLADVVVSASTDPEAFGRTIVEAQAMGRPVIAPDHGGARETVREGATGWLFRPRDEASLAEAIGRALALDLETRKSMAAAAIDNVRMHFTRARMCDATLKLYRRVLALPPDGNSADP